jgi:hypothetical protein
MIIALFPADPGIPQATAYQTEDAVGQCTLHISWTVPNNTPTSDIDRFIIYIDGVNSLNKTLSSSNNETLFSVPYVLSSCGPHDISISILDHCGQMGQPSPTLTVSPEPLCDDSTCKGHRGRTAEGDCKLECYGILILAV